MNNKNISPGQLKKGMETPSSDQDIRQLQEQVNDLQMEIDILKETINVLKKDPGVDQTALRNREKAVIVDALKDKLNNGENILGVQNISDLGNSYLDAVTELK